MKNLNRTMTQSSSSSSNNNNENAEQSNNEQQSTNEQQQQQQKQQQTQTPEQLQKQRRQRQQQQQSSEQRQEKKPSLKYCDILLNNFQISKKSYRVLLNGEHVVWERLHAKSHKAVQQEAKKQQQPQQQQQLQHGKVKGESEHEHEHVPIAACTAAPSGDGGGGGGTPIQQNVAAYGSKSHVLHIDEIINVRRGSTKQATLKPRLPGENMVAEEEEEEATSTAKPTAQYLSIHYAERVVKSATDCNRWHVRQLTLYNADPYIVRQWHQTLAGKLKEQSTRLRVRRLLVFINPYGGRKQALQMYERHCKPIFQLADVDASCIISQRANQIRDILMSHDLRVFDAVCCVGGDGTVAEVINGLLFRTMRELGLDEQRPAYIPKPMLPVGVIPAGSTDTIAYSMHGTSDVRTAAIHVILGQRRGLDISSVRNSRGLLRFCASILSYGYLGDVAAKSERYRWMGTKRYEYTGVKAFIGNRGYDAEIRMLVDEDDNDAGSVAQRVSSSVISAGDIQAATSSTSIGETSSVCYANCQRCSVAASIQECLTPEQTQALYNAAEMEDDELEVNARMLSYDKTANTHLNVVRSSAEQQVSQTNESVAPPSPPPPPPSTSTMALQQSLGESALLPRTPATFSFSPSIASYTNSHGACARWETIRGNFFMICGANITCACARSPNGISRYSHLGDGYLDLILVRKTSLINNLRFLLNTAGRNGDIRNLPFVEVYRTRKFNFRALQAGNADERYSISGSCQPIAESFPGIETPVSSWNCDGEVVNNLEITMTSHCQLIDVFMRGPYSYTKTQQQQQHQHQRAQASNSNSVFCCCRN